MSLTSCAQPPPFDYEAAKRLSAEKRREYDVIYFNEFYLSAGVMSNRYLSEDEIVGRTVPSEGNYLEKASVARRAEFRRMADAGYLPAYVFLHQTPEYVLQYSYADEALGMLAAAAKAGDASAACALTAMTRRFDSVKRRKSIAQEQTAAMAIGLKANHGACLVQHGESFFQSAVTKEGVVSYSRYDAAGFPYLFEAARQGYYLAFHLLRNLRGYELQKSNYVLPSSLPLERYLCWGRLVGQYSRSSGIDTQTITWTFRGDPRLGKPPSVDPKYFPILDKYDPAVFPLTVQVATPETCLQLETQ
ncbi:hypothetical protein ACEN8I_16180 [Polaromonas sp. CT11-55]|uniref:hypothetical protein n=1 Tax=Polaromonas sp. CT11-55 TaxID=3243045 RepID=UPI0039A4DE5F